MMKVYAELPKGRGCAARVSRDRFQDHELIEVRISTSGHAQYAAEWRTGAHDDLVLALACAVWFGEHGPKPLDASACTPARR